jgi:Icc-related predicted phosphoesterase
LKLWILSDLHLETVPFPDAFRPAPPDFDVLVAAGDIWSGHVGRGFAFLRGLAGDKPIVACLGNHEHFRGDMSATISEARRTAKAADIRLLEGDVADIQGVRFIGMTLWSDYVLAGAVDHTLPTGEDIRVHDAAEERLFRVADAQKLHTAAREHLKDLLLEQSPLPRVVVTHHAPHPACIAPADLGTWIAGNSASDLSDLTDAGLVELWVHGHVHRTIDLRRPRGTRILCNPAGALFSNPSFVEHLVVEIKR